MWENGIWPPMKRKDCTTRPQRFLRNTRADTGITGWLLMCWNLLPTAITATCLTATAIAMSLLATGQTASIIMLLIISTTAKQKSPFSCLSPKLNPITRTITACVKAPMAASAALPNQTPGDLEGTAGNWRENYPDYLGQCASLDENVGRLVDTLKEIGEWDNTVFIYTSDHGSHFCTRNKEYKRSCHDGCTHIPLIVRGPGFMGGKRENAMVSLLDLPTTLLDCAGVKKPEQFAGNSLCSLMEGKAENWPDSIFMQISESQVGRAVRTTRWKYSVRAPGNGWSAPSGSVYYEEFLYDLKNDPHERHNLVSQPEYAEVREEMKQRLLSWMERAGEEKPEIRPNSEMPENMEG